MIVRARLEILGDDWSTTIVAASERTVPSARYYDDTQIVAQDVRNELDVCMVQLDTTVADCRQQLKDAGDQLVLNLENAQQ